MNGIRTGITNGIRVGIGIGVTTGITNGIRIGIRIGFGVDALPPSPQNLRRELQARRCRVAELLDRAAAAAAVRCPEAEGVRELRERLGGAWGALQERSERRQSDLDAAFRLQQYCCDVSEVEAWLGEQELLLMGEEKGKVGMGGWGGSGVGWG